MTYLDLWLFLRSVARGHRPPPAPVAPDPIDHPDLRRMSPRDLADLPFPRLPADTSACRNALQRSLP